MTEAVPKVVVGIPTGEKRTKFVDALTYTGFLEVWEGAVRSSKTVVALVAFCYYVTRSQETVFLLSGRTVGTIERNCIYGDYGILSLIPGAVYGHKGESRAITFSVQGRVKTIYVAGASDIRAYMAIRGNSYGGWFADEINMHDREFVAEAMRRTVVSRDRRHFWTLNPDNPRHWIYEEYIDRYTQMDEDEKAKLGGFLLLHYTPEDNPAMTPAMLDSLKAQYPAGSYLYKRYIDGERCIAEGLVYPQVTDSMFRDFDVSKVNMRYASIDFGSDHPTVMYLGGYYGGNKYDWRVCAELYDKQSGKTTYDYYAAFCDLCRRHNVEPHRVQIAIDPAAKALKLEFMRHGLSVVNAKNDVLPGIDYTRSVIYSGLLSFHSSIKHLRTEFGTYSWDPVASERGEDKPLKKDDDCVDSLRYFAYTHIRPLLGGATRRPDNG